jgi:hypothetical protein
MALFVEVDDTEKGCKVIINLDCVMEVAPLRSGGCELFFPDAAAVGGKRSMKVKDSYVLFKQFAMQQVSAEDIARVNGRITKDVKKEKPPVDDVLASIPKL